MYVSSMRQLIPTGRLQWGTILQDPAVDRRVVDGHAALLHQCFDMPITQGIRHIPAHAREDNLLREMGPFEAHPHRLSPSLGTADHRGRSYLKLPPMKN